MDAPAELPGPGAFGQPCETAEDCDGTLCYQTGTVGKICNLNGCIDYCPEGWECGYHPPQDGPDRVITCSPQSPFACLPCGENSQCDDGVCAQMAAGTYCGMPCGEEGQCIAGFSCVPVSSVDGSQHEQCMPFGGSCGE